MNVEESLKVALSFHSNGKIHKAIELYNKLLFVNKKNAQIHFLLGTAYLQVGKIQNSERHLRYSLQIDSQNAYSHNNLGTALNNLKKFEEAIHHFKTAISLKSDYPDAYNNYGNSLKELNLLEEAIACYNNAIKYQPNFAEAYNNCGGALLKQRKFEEALDSYDKAIHLKPNYGDAHNNKGVTLKEMSRFIEALDCFENSISINSSNYEAHNNKGLTLINLKKYDEALLSFYESLKIYPYNDVTYNSLGIAYNSLKKFEDALFCLEKAIELNPINSDAHINKGNALKDLNRDLDALLSYEKALKIRSGDYRTLNNKGVVLQKLFRADEAIECYKDAIAINPDYAEACNNMGVAHQLKKNIQEAIECFEKAIKLSPDYPDAHYNLGNIHKDLKRTDEALASYGKAISLRSDYPEAYNNRAFVLQEVGRKVDALVDYEKALKLSPENPVIHHNRGNVLKDLKRLDEALESYCKALNINPDYEFLFGTILHLKMQICDWANFEKNLKDLVQLVSDHKTATTPFALLGLIDDPALHRISSEIYTKIKFPKTVEKNHLIAAKHVGPIKIGYFSGDFYNHATAYLMAELFESHDKNKFEIYGFSFSSHKDDEMTKKLSSSFLKYIDVTNLSDQEVIQLTREIQIDIAVDLKGYTQGTRAGIFAGRCAPIQVSYLGYPGTLGTDYIDYIIADETVIPEQSQKFFTEKVVYLPGCYQVNDSNRKISDKSFSRQEFGLPQDQFVFCCFNNNYKILPSTFDSWMRILKSVEGSVLWLFEDNTTASNNLRQHAQLRGVDSNRLIFAKRFPLDEHLARHRLADLFLDTSPYNAHTTASDALWAGLPVVTCMGQSFASRVAASLLKAVGLEELITNTQGEYEAKAIEIALDSLKLSAIKRRLYLKKKESTLFNGKAFAKNLEAAFLKIDERNRLSIEPESMTITPLTLLK